MANEKILVINPGSTSTKIALYLENVEQWKESIDHSLEELKKYPAVFDQKDMRKSLIRSVLESHGVAVKDLSAVVSRGGCLPPVHAGAYEVDDHMVEVLRDRPVDQHAANVGAAIALDLAREAGVRAFIYDALTVDEMEDINKISGLKGIRRPARGHNLNTRAAALKYCRENGLDYKSTNIIAVQLGGGITINLHVGGRMVDVIMDEEGPFSPERAGGIPTYSIVKMCFSGEYTQAEMMKRLQRAGGMISYYGTADMRVVQKMIDEGDKEAEMVFKAMGIAVAKNIAKIAVSNKGKIDVIVLTGGLAYSELFVSIIREYVGWLAPIAVIPGENEMIALAQGTLRVLRGEETADFFRD